MDNKLLRLHISIILSTLFYCSASAQYNLDYGVEEPSTVVKLPYIHRDYLRTVSPEWIREEQVKPSYPWYRVDRVLSEKDAFGNFTNLTYQHWDYNNQEWDDRNRYVYVYILDGNNRVVEIQTDEMNQFFSYSRKLNFEYDSTGNISKTAYTRNGVFHAETRYSYTLQNFRETDSLFAIMNGVPQLVGVNYYLYDNNNNCTKRIEIYDTGSGFDTTRYVRYAYTDGFLTSIDYYGGATLYNNLRREYTYISGLITGVTVYSWDASLNKVIPKNSYRHFYNNSKVSAITAASYNGSSRVMEDSIALSYLPNGTLDTGYQYLASANGWTSTPQYRLLFRKINTGITPVAPLVNAVTVYPNPVTDQLSVDVEMVKEGNISMRITDITGKLVKTINAVNLPAGKNTIKVSALDMAPGIYVVTCGNSCIKLVKE